MKVETGNRNLEIGKQRPYGFSFPFSAFSYLFGFLVFWLFGFCSFAFAFHEQGVANCEACHTVHSSENGIPMVETGPKLLKFSSATDACLSCHGTDLGSVWGIDAMHPPVEKGGGNFVFLSAGNLNDGPNGLINPISGSHAGHNVISQSRGSGMDPVYLTAPGGTYPSSALGCTSCHNPHGNTNYRLLWGQGPVAAGDFVFVNPAPQAEGIAITSPGAEQNANHAAYRSGMSAWCANCHGSYHQNSLSTFQHPVDQALAQEIAQAYNQYGGSDNVNGGNTATAYLPAVPFEDPANQVTGTVGPSLTSRISCITCHRAHGSSAPEAGRWDFNVTYLRQDGMNSGSFPIPNPFGAANQKSLCCKCHAYGEQHGGEESCISCHRGNLSRITPNIR